MNKRKAICILLTVVLVIGAFSFASAQEIIPDEDNISNMVFVQERIVDDVQLNQEIISDKENISMETNGENLVQDDEMPKPDTSEDITNENDKEEQPSVSEENQSESNDMITSIQEEAPEEELLIAPLAAGDEATLRSDIANAAPGGVIEISGNIHLTGTPLTVDKNLTFRSTGGTVQLTVAGNIRHINASAGVTLTFEGVELVGNAPTDGGGIEALGDISLFGAVIKDCQAAQGGGVNAVGSVYVSGVTISGNTATGNGGGLYSAGNLNFESGTIAGNSAGLDGGGIYSPAPNAFMLGGTISGNTAQRDGGGYCGLSIFVLNGTITGNHAFDSGGGLFVESVVIENGTISNNVAGTDGGGIHTEQTFEINGGSINSNSAVQGGGVHVFGQAQLNGGVISKNNATTGGGLYIVGDTEYAGTEISSNTATGDGGGIYQNGTIDMYDGNMTGNTATSGNGGGIYAAGNFGIKGGTISENEAGVNGGGVYTVAPNAFLRGGTITGNTAKQDGGGFYGSITFVIGSSITSNHAMVDGGGIFGVNVTVESGLIDGNIADGYGGGIYSDNWIEINNGTISNNTATNGGGVSTIGDVDFNQGFLTGNIALQDGGGIYGTLANITVAPNAAFADNSASRGYLIKEEDKALYATKIFTTQITQPFTYAYNNFDINYAGIEIEYVVTFDTQGGSAVEPALVIAGSTAVKPADPVRDGYTFTGWYQDAAATQLWDFATPVNSNITLYAGWQDTPAPAVTYTVTFDSRGGSTVEAITNITAGSTINTPADPTRDGYTFNGWFVDEAATQKWDFATDAVNGNMTLYAGWDAAQESTTTSTTTSTTDTPKTGDTTDLWLYVWIAVAGAAILTGLLLKVKYQQKRK